MLLNLSSEISPSIGLAVGNHLWQSTLFAIAAGVLTLAFRKNHARSRYWLWMTASVKFLIPFSLLTGIGNHLTWQHGAAASKMGLYFAVQEIGRPFSHGPFPVIAPAVASASAAVVPFHPLALIVAALWLSGSLVVLCVWYLRWRRISAIRRNAVPLGEGREWEALRRAQGVEKMQTHIQMVLSPASLEPGIFGIAKPALIWPHGISERLNDAQMEAIVAHELCHVRRRDNLTAAIHMAVEAIFWFHPLLWWMGARLVHERERACDEAVISAGIDRLVYAEVLLTVCKFYFESPLVCITGVTGADLKRRIEVIMTERIPRQLTLGKKALLAGLGSAAVLAPIVTGSIFAIPSPIRAQTQEASSAAFQSVTVQESQPGALGINIHVGIDNFTVRNYPLRTLMAFAYDSQDGLISGPDALNVKYNVEGKAPAPFPSGSGYQAVDAARAMVRQLLVDQFQLAVHQGTQVVPAYVLTKAGGTALIKASDPRELGPTMGIGPTFIRGNSLQMDDFVELLSQRLGRPVVDQTGLTATYDFKLDWGGESKSTSAGADGAPAPLPTVSPDVLDAALQAQLGLALQLTQGPVKVLIVDNVQQPQILATAYHAIPLDPAVFDNYVGEYQFPGNLVMKAYRDKAKFYIQLSGQPAVQVFPFGRDKFFAEVVDAQISFTLDSQGRASALVLHQNGRDISAPRLDKAAAKELADSLKARVQAQTARPGSEQALRHLIQGLASGKPDYEQMSPELAAATRQQLTTLNNGLKSAGALISLKFKGVGPQGADIYEAQHEHAAFEWRISLTADGKVAGALVRPAAR